MQLEMLEMVVVDVGLIIFCTCISRNIDQLCKKYRYNNVTKHGIFHPFITVLSYSRLKILAIWNCLLWVPRTLEACGAFLAGSCSMPIIIYTCFSKKCFE